ncbi:aldolase [Choiromyces venosus 120613-1]|uniref:Aldolase n=1 Tax=Choiromyces venosus 120613-1 TaxID=1336337 RepID=A0A3N4IZW6_9PEZI|nr:aldolase [Choiromyces venosus 120613-1]
MDTGTGIYVPEPTFFIPPASKEHNLLTPPSDSDAQANYAPHLARPGTTGLALLGSAGEVVHLARTERVAQIKHMRAALTAGGYEDYPLIAGTATNGIEETMELLNESAAAGAGWGLVLAPGYFAAAKSEEGIIACTFRTLAAHPNIPGGKLSHGDISIHTQIALDPETDHSKFHLFTGLGQQLFPALQVGCSGATDGLAAILPKTVVRSHNLVTRTEAMDQETLDRVRELQYRVSHAEELIKFGTVGVKVAVARVLSFGEPDGGRLPLARGMGSGRGGVWK